MNELKFCRGCSQDLPRSDFAKRADRPIGTSSRCKKCLSGNRKKKYQDPEFAEKDKARASKWARDNPEIRKKTAKKYLENNPDQVLKVRGRSKRWYENNKDRVRETQKTYEKERYNSDLNYKLRKRLRSRIYDIFRSNCRTGEKAGSHVKDLGCSIEELISYMEAKFSPGMSWDNHGTSWEIDHIKHLASFDLSDKKQFLTACHYSNLQPLWIEEHREKTQQDLLTK